MKQVADWHINATWTVSGIFATGSVWYFASAKDWTNVAISAAFAMAFIIFAIYLHKLKDRQAQDQQKDAAQKDSLSLSKNPTKHNIERVILLSDPKSDWNCYSDIDRTVYSFVEDVNLRLEMPNGEHGIQCEDFREPWANKFPDKRATGYWCNLYYGSTQIGRYILVAVDGARALLPIPKLDLNDGAPRKVLPIDYKIAQIHDSIDSLDDYMKMAGLVVAE